MNQGADRRICSRHESHCPAEILWFDVNRPVPARLRPAEIVDMSETGLRVRVPPFPPGSGAPTLPGHNIVRIWMRPPGADKEIAITGDIRWMDCEEGTEKRDCDLGVFISYYAGAGRTNHLKAMSFLRSKEAQRGRA